MSTYINKVHRGCLDPTLVYLTYFGNPFGLVLCIIGIANWLGHWVLVSTSFSNHPPLHTSTMVGFGQKWDWIYMIKSGLLV